MTPDYYDAEGSPVHEWEVENMYRDMLDECHPTVRLCGIEYEPARVLEATDHIAYRCGLLDYIDSLINDHVLFEDDPTAE